MKNNANNNSNDPIALKLMRLLFKRGTPIAPKMMGQLAYNLWLTPSKSRPHEKELFYAQQAKVNDIHVDGLKIKVWSWGSGPTVLFVHGWGGRGTQISGFIEMLTQSGFNVMSFDMPAHGQSQGNRTNAFSVAKTMREIIRQIDDLHTVITHSFGGIIFGYEYHSAIHLKNVVMICPPATLHTAFNQFSQTLLLPDSVQDFVQNKLFENFGKDVFEKLSLLKNAAKITQPVLVVHDTQDDVVPFQDGQQVVNVLKNGHFHQTQTLGHRKILFDNSVIKYISEFLRTNV